MQLKPIFYREHEAKMTQHRIFYVSNSGDDRWSGGLPTANADATDGPLASLSAARDAIRALKASSRFTGPITVLILDGTYRLASPLSLGVADSGEADKPITYCAFPGCRPVITGGRVISDWQPYRDRILRATVPEAIGGGYRFRQLFFEGRRMVRARWPSFEPKDPYHGGWAFIEKTLPEDDENPRILQYEPTTVTAKKWAKPHQAELFIFPWYNWLSELLPVVDADRDARTLTMGGKFILQDMRLFAGNRFRVENVLEELDQAGEWQLDTDTGTVYFWPPHDNPLDDSVTIPGPDRLIEIVGEKQDPARYINVRGLTLTQTLCPFPEQLHPNFHSPTLRGEAIRIENASHCRIEDNSIDQVGGDGIRLQESTSDVVIANNVISQTGASGISIAADVVGLGGTWTDSQELKVNSARAPRAERNVITNNLIHHTGVFKKNCGGVQVYGVNSIDNVISHNEIHHTSDKGMIIQDGFGRFVVEYNHLHDIALEICDTGGIMTNRWFVIEGDEDLGRANIFRYNLIENVIGCGSYDKLMEGLIEKGTKAGGRIWSPYYTWGIYFDNSGMNCTIFGNIIIGTMLGGTSTPVGDARDNLIANNIIVDCKLYQIDLRVGGEAARGNRVLRNIFSYRDPKAALAAINPNTAFAYAECDYNLLDVPGGAPPTIASLGFGKDDAKIETFEQWRRSGRDTHSVISDALFVDRENGDWRLRPESPAFALGFEPIDVSKIGRRPHVLTR
jgi:parallel beta-helix repeat protein